MEDLGLGTLREISHPHNSKKSKLFVKHKFENLSEEELAFLVSLSREEFNASFELSSE